MAGMKTSPFLCSLFSLQLAAIGLCSLPAFAKQPTREAEALFQQARTAERNNQPDRAINLLHRVISIEPLALNAYINLSADYAEYKHDFVKAESIIKRALKIAPKNFPCEYEYAQLLVDQEKFREARQVLLKAHPATSSEKAKRDKQVQELNRYLANSNNARN